MGVFSIARSGPSEISANSFTGDLAPVFSVMSSGGTNFSRHDSMKKRSVKIHPLESPQSISELQSPSSNNSCQTRMSLNSASPMSFRSSCRYEEEEAEDSDKHFFTPSSEFYHDSPDTDFSPSSCGAPFDSESMAVLTKPNFENRDSVNASTISQKCLDFENNGSIWFPPQAEDENDDVESALAYDDDEDEMLPSSSSLCGSFQSKEKQNEEIKEPQRAVIHGHFRALVSQLLQGDNIKGGEEWLDLVTKLAWQAAYFVKPDTSRGGSMDPCDYVKIKCIATGKPSDSTLVKGVVCTKNIKHKRMTTQYKSPRLFLLGGALEYHSVVNPLASLETLVQQEKDHLRMIISKIEALRPNVLLVERSVSPYAQEYLLAKDISLVLNVRRPLLERIARCTGALICPSIENISTTRCGHCEHFRVERVSEEHENRKQSSKKSWKTLMHFEGCSRRLGCTVILKGANREDLKKIKHVVQYAVFAAYHLSLETSFLADEGAVLPKATLKHNFAVPDKIAVSVVSPTAADQEEHPGSELLSVLLDDSGLSALSPGYFDYSLESSMFDEYYDTAQSKDYSVVDEEAPPQKCDGDESGDYFSSADTYQSILVSFSSRSVMKAAVCERARLLRIKFYGSFDKPLGRYLRDDLFDPGSYCRSCNDPAEAHVLCYTHQQGNLTISVRSLPDVKLPGERDGKIWMWHRCLRCARVDGVPPATRRVVMSDAAWGLSFGKFLELSFSNHATANRVAPCGHSLQKDCLRFYGLGSMIAFFRYSPIDILNVHLPPSQLEFADGIQQEWMLKEADELSGRMKNFYGDVADALHRLESRCKIRESEDSAPNGLLSHLAELKCRLVNERGEFNSMLNPASVVDVLELNQIRLASVITALGWDHQLYSLDSLSTTNEASSKEESNFLLNEDSELETNMDGDCEETGNDESNLSDRIDSVWTGTSPLKRGMTPVRFYSFDSAFTVKGRNQKKFLPSSSHSSRSFHTPRTPPMIPSVSAIKGDVRLLLSQRNQRGMVLPVYDDDPASIVSYVISSKDHDDWIENNELRHEDNVMRYEDGDSKGTPHFTVSHGDDAIKFTVTCYFAKQFDGLRKRCCPNDVDFVRSLSRCQRWSAQGGKTNVYFAKSLDDRFIIKQVQKTELTSFEEFAPEYFKYLTDSLNSRSPTCLAKILGFYNVSVKQLKGGKEVKMSVMVMENLFYQRRISRVYDLKGSARSRYNEDASARNAVLLDMNLVEALRTEPIFLSSRAKRSMERAIWNDTSFLASVDVIDYSLLVGADEERKELVVGMIDYLRQYTWDKQLETLVKASGILGGPKNASPTIISPVEYKRRFRKAMTSYFLTVPDQWPSSPHS